VIDCHNLPLQYFAHLRIVPVVAVLSEPSPGHHLIELDAVAISSPHRPWFAPITWLLPAEIAKNVHLKIGVNGSLDNGKVGQSRPDTSLVAAQPEPGPVGPASCQLQLPTVTVVCLCIA